jgi:CDK-activating kinase assembly factor MAT1
LESFNREQDDFETLRDYNDYLNEVEDATYNLIYGIDIEATEKKMREYQAANRQAIEDNLQRAKQGTDDYKALQAAEKEAVRLRRQAALQEEEEERRIREEERRELLRKLESGGDAAELKKQSQHAVLRRAKTRREALAKTTEDTALNNTFTIKGLKKYVEPEVEKPYDPFNGMDDEREYYEIYDQYKWQAFDNLQTERALAGGISFKEHMQRALCDAFSGLGVFIGDESPAMAGHAITTSDRAMDDVF